ncbi:MAG: pyridoxamine 5'-phosphate oxidase family protein [Anaerolineales bacterium]|nr:pyridoxamine 5'-phosphate oxidase family protein [Anaerolineales bacterium]
MAALTTAQVWKELENNVFAVLGMVTAKNEPRTVGIVYVVHEGKLYIGTKKDAWKVRHVSANPHVSLTVAIPKSVPLMPWIKVPAATITFAGTAQVVTVREVGADVLAKLYRGLTESDAQIADSRVIVVDPTGDFVTYGVGVSLMGMRDTENARGRAPVK